MAEKAESQAKEHQLPCLVIAGPSGVGKGTIIKRLRDNHPGVFGFSVSHATRKPRSGEVDGLHYNFVSVEEFERLIEENYFLEHAKVHGNYYGTSFAAIQNVVDEGRLCILDIDVQGSRSARRAGLKGAYIFVSPPSLEELERRLRGRGSETEESLKKRMETTTFEMAATDEEYMGARLFDSVICNDDLEETVKVFETLLAEPIATVTKKREARHAALEQAQPAGKTVTEELSVGWMVRTRVRTRLIAFATCLAFAVVARRTSANRTASPK